MGHDMKRPTSHRLDRFARKRLSSISSIPNNKNVSTSQAAELLQTTVSFLYLGRNCQPPFGPPYHRLSQRHGYYVVGEIKQWLAERDERFSTRGKSK